MKPSRIGKAQQLKLDNLKEDCEYFKTFNDGIKSEQTRRSYWKQLDWFVVNQKLKNYAAIVNLTPAKLMDNLKDHNRSIKHLSYSSVNQALCSLFLFCDMNELVFSRRVLKKSMPVDDEEPAGERSYTRDEIQRMLKCTKIPRTIALILMWASIGARPGVLEDPQPLAWEHAKTLPSGHIQLNLYAGSKKWSYYVTLTMEATKALLQYKQSRINKGENVTDESPIFSVNRIIKTGIHAHMTANSGRDIIRNLYGPAGIKRNRVGKSENSNKYDLAEFYGFRKRVTNIILGCKDINQNLKEKMISHVVNLDGVYYKPPPQDYFKAFLEVEQELVIDDTERLRVENSKLQAEKNNQSSMDEMKLTNGEMREVLEFIRDAKTKVKKQ